MRNFMIALTAASLVVPATAVVLPTAASAQSYYNGKVWRDRYGHMRCKRKNGTTGLIIGAAGGALVGHAVGGNTTGTILGAAAGGLLGRHVERHSGSRYRCS